MIEFSEEEYLESTVSDLTLSWVLYFYGQTVKDRLLYAPIRLDNINSRRYLETRTVTCSNGSGSLCDAQDEGGKEEDTPIYTVGIGI